VTATVIKVSGSGHRHALVRIGDGVFRARTNMSLLPGQRLQVRVFVRGGTLVLRKAASAASTASALGPHRSQLPTSLYPTVSGILARSGLPANERGVEALLARARRIGRRGLQALRFLAILQEKGMEAPDSLVEQLVSLAGTDGEEGDEGDRSQDHRDQSHRERNGPQDQPSEADSRQKSKDTREALVVANHLKGRRDQWVIVPFSAASKGVEVNGAMRVLLDSASGAARRMILAARAPTKRWNVAVESASNRVSRVSILCDPTSLSSRLRRETAGLRRALATRGIRLDITAPPAGFDGFSPGPGDYEHAGVDRMA
jgi:hypothetical protein